MCVLLKTPVKYKLCILPDDSEHIFYAIRVITSPQSSMSESVIQKLNCKTTFSIGPI